jgi:hypothetical protein
VSCTCGNGGRRALREKSVGDGGCGCAEDEKSGGSYHILTTRRRQRSDEHSCPVGISSTIKDHVIAYIT